MMTNKWMALKLIGIVAVSLSLGLIFGVYVTLDHDEIASCVNERIQMERCEAEGGTPEKQASGVIVCVPDMIGQ
jgi:hypothetical protein